MHLRLDKETDTISREEFLEIEFKYGGLPVLYRDILYNLLGYAFGIQGLKAIEIVEFYRRLINDNQAYIQWHETKRHFE